MSMSSRTQDDIDAEASLWLAQKRMLAPADFDSAGFDAWLAADTRHQATYAFMVRAETAAASLTRNPDLSHVDAVAAGEKSNVGGRAARTWLIGLSAAAALLIALYAPAFFAPPSQAALETEIAQIDRQVLSDGSVVTLGPASRIEIAFSANERRVVLASGEAFFEVSHDAERPFFVEAGDALVRVVGTKFDVHRSGERVRVAVAEGVVQVRSASLPLVRENAQPIVLTAGAALQVNEQAPLWGARAEIAAQTPTHAGAWREGRLTYVEAPLSELVADLNRYYAPGVRLSDASLANYRLTASFEAAQIEAFFETLPNAAPLSVERNANGRVTINPES